MSKERKELINAPADRIFEDNKIILAGCLIFNEKKEILLLKRHEGYYETPGGKVSPADCKNPKLPTKEDFLKAALRELREELGGNVKINKPKFFAKVEFKTPKGTAAIVYKFMARYKSGAPKICEPKTFEKSKWIRVLELENYSLSPDLVLILPKLRSINRKCCAGLLRKTC